MDSSPKRLFNCCKRPSADMDLYKAIFLDSSLSHVGHQSRRTVLDRISDIEREAAKQMDFLLAVIALTVIFHKGGGDRVAWAVQLYFMVLVLVFWLVLNGRLG